MEESRLRGDGSKVVTKQGRQSLARVSALDGRLLGSESNALVMMDDYVVQAEPVVDHLTRFSGITPGEVLLFFCDICVGNLYSICLSKRGGRAGGVAFCSQLFGVSVDWSAGVVPP